MRFDELDRSTRVYEPGVFMGATYPKTGRRRIRVDTEPPVRDAHSVLVRAQLTDAAEVA